MKIQAWKTAARTLACLAGVALWASSAAAVDDEKLADLLEEKGYISAEERDSVEEDTPPVSAGADEKKTEDEKTEAEAKPRPDISVGYKGLIITSADKRFRFAFGGRLQVDAGGFISDITQLGAGIELRRARIKSYGYLYNDFQYKLEVNFDSDLSVPVTDAWLRWRGLKPFTVTVGHQKVPFSQQSMTSSNWQVFQERSLQDAFIDNAENGRRRLGVVLGGHGDHWNLQWGVFAEGVGTAGTNSEDFGTAARAVWAPIAEKTKVLAFGGSAYYRMFSSQTDLQYAARPESHISGAKLVDTGIIRSSGLMTNVQDQILFNFDASMVCGPFHAQAEYTGVQVNRMMGAPGLYFYGYYAQAGWFITGESRNYQIKSGKYKRPMPTNDRLGAWEVAARWSSISLQNKDILGGRENNFTAGVNWWINTNLVLRFNYVYAMLRPSSTEAGLGGVDENVNAFMTRAQIVF